MIASSPDPSPHLSLVDGLHADDQAIGRTLRTGRPPVARFATLLAVDVNGFGSLYPRASDQISVRDRVHGLVKEACEMTRLPFWESHREDRGDGLLLVSPSDARPDLFLDPLAHHLRILIRQANHDEAAVPMRLRMAVHHGTVHYDAHGVTSSDLILLHRLVEANAFKRAVSQTATELGLITSDTLYQMTARTSPYVNADAYRKITVNSKELRQARAWLWTA